MSTHRCLSDFDGVKDVEKIDKGIVFPDTMKALLGSDIKGMMINKPIDIECNWPRVFVTSW